MKEQGISLPAQVTFRFSSTVVMVKQNSSGMAINGCCPFQAIDRNKE
jgi:hypothetical protein